MKIVVCVKQVPDTKGGVKFNPDGTLDRAAMLTIMNPDDKAGLEAALRLKDQYGAEVTVLTMGLPKADEVLREAMAMGADKGILVTDRVLGGADTWATSTTIAGALRNLDYDLIITGRQAIDGDTAQVGPQIAEHLGLPQITYALDIIEKDGDIQVKRECDEGYDMISTQLPAVVTVVRLPYEPRYPTIKSKMAAKKKEIPVLTEEDIPAINLERCGLSGSPTKVKKTYTPVTEKNGVKLEGMEAEDAAKEVERECIYLPPFYYAEVGVANKLKKLSEEPAGDRLWVSLMRARQKTGNSELSVDVELSLIHI